MNLDPQKLSENFLELASEHRLDIVLSLLLRKTNLSNIAKELNATVSEVHRNLNRLQKIGIITKDSEGEYIVTNYGMGICHQFPSFAFLQKNKIFFDEHSFGDLPIKFIQRIGALQSGQHIQGFVKVLENWKFIHENANKYIYTVLSEIPYSQDIINIVITKLQNGIKIKSIISENAIIPAARKNFFDKNKFHDYIKNGTLERRMKNKVSLAIILNENTSCVIFPKRNGIPDMGEAFYSSDSSFHEWCLDYFNDLWNNSSTFMESKLKYTS